MTELAEVAKDVAEALGLRKKYEEDAYPWFTAEGNYLTDPYILADGSNLTDPYWRCACEDWLLAQGWEFSPGMDGVHEAWQPAKDEQHWRVAAALCPWPEAPARLVSAVWRKQRDRP